MAKFKLNSQAIDYMLRQSQKDIDIIVKKALQDTANDVQNKITQFIQEYFYDQYDPIVYQRTYQLLNSVTQTKIVKIGSTYQITVFLNPKSDYNNSGSERFYINKFGQYTVPSNYSQAFNAMDVFEFASKGIHGLPPKGKSGWNNNRYIETSPNFADMINDEMLYTNLLTRYHKMLKSSGFSVKII